MYSLTYKVTTSTCDSEGKLKLYSALQMMQDCSEMWIDSEPEVKDYFLQQNMAQLLATRQVEIIRVPDIDYNKHLNNANYVRMAMELLPEDFVVSGLRVEYRVAAKLGDCLTPTIYKIADGIIVSLSIGNEVSAIIEFT